MYDFRRQHDFVIGIDSDGCAFDTMEIKHKECFIPNTIKHFGLQAVSKYAREAAEFVNLYSKWRGINRFPALVNTIDILLDRPEVARRKLKFPDIAGLREWIKRETKLGNPTLEKEVAATSDAALVRALEWSKAVNAAIERMVEGVPPFPFVRESLEKLRGIADMVVCSATPGAALNAEWEEHEISQFVQAICGQEMGSKKEILQRAAAAGYSDNRVLMIGDAPGDMQAARANGALFYPINPGAEEASWERFFTEACDRFLKGTYAGGYEAVLIAEFDAFLPEVPPWKRAS
ncbi:MAG TPA: HAD hydrolase-like protein [Planctomycetaceae bacterium]|nr:HAD hydrolase-like protein [Planctomycetaceae bacterium]